MFKLPWIPLAWIQLPWTRLAKENADLRVTIESMQESLIQRIHEAKSMMDAINATSKQLDNTIATLETLSTQVTAFAAAFGNYNHRVLSIHTSKSALLCKIQNDRVVLNALLTVLESMQATFNTMEANQCPQS